MKIFLPDENLVDKDFINHLKSSNKNLAYLNSIQKPNIYCQTFRSDFYSHFYNVIFITTENQLDRKYRWSWWAHSIKPHNLLVVRFLYLSGYVILSLQTIPAAFPAFVKPPVFLNHRT